MFTLQRKENSYAPTVHHRMIFTIVGNRADVGTLSGNGGGYQGTNSHMSGILHISCMGFHLYFEEKS